MGSTHSRSISDVRSEWCAATIDSLQAAAGRMLLVDRVDAPSVLELLARSLPVPHGRVEPLILRGLLVEFAAEHGTVIHERAHRANRSTLCRFDAGAHLRCFRHPGAVGPIDGFTKWIRSFFSQFDATHPLSAANRAAGLIRSEYRYPWSVTELARRVHSSPAQLARTFQKEYAVSIKEYQRIIRLIEALDRLHGDKIDAVALDVGYRSKKNFYRALRHVTGMSPTEFRQLSRDRSAQLIDDARFALGHRGTQTWCHTDKKRVLRQRRCS